MYYIVRHPCLLPGVGESMQWSSDAIAYVRSPSDRSACGVGIEPTRAQKVMDDVDLLAFEPDPTSRMGASRFIGRSHPPVGCWS